MAIFNGDLADPKMDMVFRKIFGEKGRENIIKSFLNSVLDRPEKIAVIEKIEYIENSLLPVAIGQRGCIIDVHCKDQNNHQYIVEMQVANQDYFAQRAVYYVAGALVRQLKKNEKFNKVKKVHLVAVLDFKLFGHTKNCITHHTVFDRDNKKIETHPWIEFTYIELPKFDKTMSSNDLTDADRWIMFFSQAHKEGILKKLSKEVDEIKDAYDILNYQNWSKADRAIYENQLKKELDVEAQVSTAKRKGKEEGIAEGMEKGMEKAKVEMAKTMLENGIDLKQVAKITCLQLAFVKSLIKNNH